MVLFLRFHFSFLLLYYQACSISSSTKAFDSLPNDHNSFLHYRSLNKNPAQSIKSERGTEKASKEEESKEKEMPIFPICTQLFIFYNTQHDVFMQC